MIGDVFVPHILNEILTCDVDQILIVNPDETETMLIENGKESSAKPPCARADH